MQRNKIQTSQPDQLYSRYLICKNFEALKEIAAHDLSGLPIENALLVDNFVMKFLRQILDSHPNSYRHAREWGDSYSNEEDYYRAHPDAEKTKKCTPAFSYFDGIRNPTAAELRERVVDKDGITKLLLEAGVAIEEIARVVARWEYCGDNAFQEMYRLRPLWGVFLAVRNITQRTVTLESIDGTFGGQTFKDFRPFDECKNEKATKLRLPKSPLAPDMTALIPIAIVLAPLHHIPEEDSGYMSLQELTIMRTQELKHIRFPKSTEGAFRVWGPRIRPKRVNLLLSGQLEYQQVHELDLQNLYTLDRFWEVGSCPHLFFVHETIGKVFYAGELFAQSPNILSENQIQVPTGISTVVIAELESEKTYLKSITYLGKALLKDNVLSKGETVVLKVRSKCILRFSGFYLPEISADKLQRNPWFRNELVGNFLATLQLTA